MTLKIDPIPLLKDNYAYLLVDDSGKVAILDPAEAGPVQLVLEEKGLKPDYILNTHHHGDHTAGNKVLKQTYECEVVGPAAERERIPALDRGLGEGDVFTFGGTAARIIETPGHTSGHICFHFEKDKALFCGDTLFAMGCGRVFEGTPAQMWDSLQKLAVLPEETKVYCGHEYTLSNGEFALGIEPGNTALQKRMTEVRALRQGGLPTIPSTIGLERETNVFLRAGSAETFAAIRAAKDAG